jgi:dTDP-4-amino-4,6-dideoxy-D-galactose acyltransferase
MDTVCFLPWDSDFFALKAGKIDLENCELDVLPQVLDQALKAGYELLYVTGPNGFLIDDAILGRWGGRFVDQRVDYRIELEPNQFKDTEAVLRSFHGIKITERSKYEADSDLKHLAVLAGGLSRFVKDTRLDPSKAKRLFEIWIEKSALGENGETVFLAKGPNDQAVGFATIGFLSDHARIGLIAVKPENQGQGVGRSLLIALKVFALSKGRHVIKVATQIDNLAANHLYSKANFVVDSMRKTYHFLLR